MKKDDILKMTDIELVNKLRSISYVSGINDTDEYDDDIFTVKTELLSRLDKRQEKTIKMIKSYLEATK